jgi:hypothetical protein
VALPTAAKVRAKSEELLKTPQQAASSGSGE